VLKRKFVFALQAFERLPKEVGTKLKNSWPLESPKTVKRKRSGRVGKKCLQIQS
jgi:hypothetical protein